jgi:excinuclease ABC subunit C
MDEHPALSDATASFDASALIAGLPQRPGVYRMIDAQGVLLYVGKAGNLRRRVASYFQRRHPSPRTAHMVSKVAQVDVTVTGSETEALLLENNLIKQGKPRYNILFRDDKTYPYLRIGRGDYARIAYYRGATDGRAHFFGPFPSAWAVKESLQILQKVFHLRTCEDSVFSNRSRPCLEHQIGRCSAPCVGLISEADYALDRDRALRFLGGESQQILAELESLMHESSASLEFEKAAVLRNRMSALSRVLQQQSMQTETESDVDVIALAAEQGTGCIVLAMIRGGHHLGDRSFFVELPALPGGLPEADGEWLDEVFHRFAVAHYEHATPPPRIVTSHLPEEALKAWIVQRAGAPVKWIRQPHGVARQWLAQAQSNASLALRQRQSAQGAARLRTLALLQALGHDTAALAEESLSDFRIECFDISHSAGEATQGSCVSYHAHAMQPKRYRRYNIDNITPGDDYAAMAQVLERRYGESAESLPNLVLIDGGKGQVSVASKLFATRGYPLGRIVGVAKGEDRKVGRETLMFADGRAPLSLPADSLALMLIAQIRDEAHRFAVSGMRARRGKERQVSQLDEIEGIGARRKQRLLARFGGLRGVMAASAEELAKVEGISATMAETIYRQLRS